MKSSMEIKRGLGTFLILFSIGLLTWLLWPYQQENNEIIFDPGELILNQLVDYISIPGEIQKFPVFVDKIVVKIDWTPVIRKGDIGTIQLRVLQEFSSPDSTIGTDLEILSPESSFIDVFEEYSVLASARIVLADLVVNPQGEIGTVLSKGQNSSFKWTLIPDSTGFFQGTAWFYLDAFSNEGDQVISQPVSAQDFEFKVISLLGLDLIYLWITALVIFLCGVILIFDPLKNLSRTLDRKLAKKSK